MLCKERRFCRPPSAWCLEGHFFCCRSFKKIIIQYTVYGKGNSPSVPASHMSLQVSCMIQSGQDGRVCESSRLTCICSVGMRQSGQGGRVCESSHLTCICYVGMRQSGQDGRVWPQRLTTPTSRSSSTTSTRTRSSLSIGNHLLFGPVLWDLLSDI